MPASAHFQPGPKFKRERRKKEGGRSAQCTPLPGLIAPAATPRTRREQKGGGEQGEGPHRAARAAGAGPQPLRSRARALARAMAAGRRAAGGARANRAGGMPWGAGSALVLALALALAASAAAPSAAFEPHPDAEHDVHIVFSTECTTYFDWQTLGLAYSHIQAYDKAGLAHPPLTRLMACDKEAWAGEYLCSEWSHPSHSTHWHPNWGVHPVTGDHYTPYNKPASVKHWLENGNPKARVVVILDADMVIRAPIGISQTGVLPGRPVSALYGYLIGVYPENYMKVKEEVQCQPNCNFQQVGGFMVHYREDIEKAAPLWLHYTERVRQDKDSWGNTGDIFNSNGKSGPPWISEMYGYVFGCAEAGLNHTVSNDFMLYPGYSPPKEPFPLVLHYGITFDVNDYAFDKHWYKNGHFYQECPGETFVEPIPVDSLAEKQGTLEWRRKEIALFCAWTLHESQLWHNNRKCGGDGVVEKFTRYKCSTSANNVRRCTAKKSTDPAFDPREELESHCKDKETACCDWATKGECDNNPGFMTESCPRSCGICGDSGGCVGAGGGEGTSEQNGGTAAKATAKVRGVAPEVASVAHRTADDSEREHKASAHQASRLGALAPRLGLGERGTLLPADARGWMLASWGMLAVGFMAGCMFARASGGTRGGGVGLRTRGRRVAR